MCIMGLVLPDLALHVQGARTADDGVDPFSRRKTRPMNYWTTRRGQQDGAEGGAAGARMCLHVPAKGAVPTVPL